MGYICSEGVGHRKGSTTRPYTPPRGIPHRCQRWYFGAAGQARGDRSGKSTGMRRRGERRRAKHGSEEWRQESCGKCARRDLTRGLQ
eukprot:762645-Hanusia_phi.AAC.5